MVTKLVAMLGVELQLDKDLVPDGAPQNGRTALRMVLYLSSDHKLVATVLGHGGSGCSHACFLCKWRRGMERFALGEQAGIQKRTNESITEAARWAETYLRPIAIAAEKVRHLRSPPWQFDSECTHSPMQLHAACGALCSVVTMHYADAGASHSRILLLACRWRKRRQLRSAC